MALTDREAADRRANQIVSDVTATMLGQVTAARNPNVGLALHTALRDAVRTMRMRFVQSYARLPGCGEPPLRDELATIIQDRMCAFLRSTGVTYSAEAGLRRLVTQLESECYGVARDLEMAAYETAAESRIRGEGVAPAAPSVPTAEAPVRSDTWTLNVKNVVSDDLRRVLENEVRELAVAEDRGLHIAGIVLAGSIGEGLLYDALRSEKARAMAASKAPPGRGGLPKDVEKDEWKLADYINVAAELGMLVPTTQRMAHDVLRDFRNMIHPKVQVEKKLRPDASELKASIAWLEAVARDLAEYRRAKMSPSSPSS